MNDNKTSLIENFKEESVVFIPQLIDPLICKEAVKYIKENEERICEKYENDKRCLALEANDNKKVIKYFERPLNENRLLFGQFINSRVFKLAKELLNDEAYFISGEIHSRIAGGSEIPKHQDNAYYGLEDGNALTFYIALNEQDYNAGGLKYIANVQNKEYRHKASNSRAFSLEMDNIEKHGKEEKLFNFQAGDATIHHSRSIHYAEAVPEGTERSLVFRITLYGENERQRKGHKEWYEKMIADNRRNN